MSPWTVAYQARSSVHGTFQARVLEWVAIFLSPGDLPNPGIEPGCSRIEGRRFTV